MTFDFTTEGQVRKAFWIGMPQGVQVRGKRQNGYNATIRSEWCEFVDMLQKNGHISESLAERVTL